MSSPSRKSRHYSSERIFDRSEEVRRIRDQLGSADTASRRNSRAVSRAVDADETQYELVPTAAGRILELCMAIPTSIANRDSAVLKVYLAFLTSLPADRTVLVICDAEQIERIESLFSEANVRCEIGFIPFKPARNPLPFGTFEHTYTTWIQDPFIAVQSRSQNGHVKLIEPVGFFDLSRRVDVEIADHIAGARALTSTHATESVFMGGNVLSLTDHVLVGGDELYHHNILLPDALIGGEVDREQQLAQQLRKHLHTTKSILFIRTSAVLPQAGARATTIDGREWREDTVGALNNKSVQPIFHIDMFITPTGLQNGGKDIILVGDPALATSQLKRVKTDSMMIPAFDEIADFLAQHFHVIRNPLPLVFMDLDDGKKVPERKWYFASYNNALVEADGNARRVWLPNYGFGNWAELKATDETNRRIWRELGFTIHDIGDCHPLAERRGVIHCITNVIRRASQPAYSSA